MTFYSERERTARTAKRCGCCNTPIAIGERYIGCAGIGSEDFFWLVAHVECRAWEVEVNRMAGCTGDDFTSLLDHIDNEGRENILNGAPPEVIARFRGITDAP